MQLKQAQEGNIHIEVTQVYHWPTLKTVLMVEKILRDAKEPVSIEELKRRLPTKIMDQTLRVILSYFEDKGFIIIGDKGVSWIKNDNPKFLKMLNKSRGIEL